MMYLWKVKLHIKEYDEWFGDYYILGEDFQDAIKQADKLISNEETNPGQLIIVSIKRKFEIKLTTCAHIGESKEEKKQ